MRKEVIWAILGGILFGLVLAIGIYRINKRLKIQNTKTKLTTQTPKPESKDFKISLLKPENEDVETEDKITVEGITKPNVWVQVAGENTDYLTKSSNEGDFKQEVTLESGLNQIKITAFDPNGLKSEDKVLVLYSSLFEKINSDSIKAVDESTQSAIRAKVQEKVNKLLDKPKGYVGIVTDIASGSIEIKSKSGEIRQISTSNDIVHVVKTSPTNKEVKLTDIAIGDWIAALGYKDENSVLEAQRILIIPEVKENLLDVVFGTITKITKNSVFLGQTEYTFDKTAKVKFTNLKNDQQVIIVGKRSLFVLE